MNCKYEEYFFDKRANEYFTNALYYGYTLDHQLLKQLDIESGEISAYLPKNYEELNIYRFGGGYVAKRDDSLECIISEIERFLRAGENNICLLEDALRRPDDKSLKHKDVPILFCNNEVYFYIESIHANKQSIKYAITEAEQPNYFVCALSSKPLEEYLLNISDHLISADIIEKIAIRTEKIILGAYDGEGYLIWHRNRGNSGDTITFPVIERRY